MGAEDGQDSKSCNTKSDVHGKKRQKRQQTIQEGQIPKGLLSHPVGAHFVPLPAKEVREFSKALLLHIVILLCGPYGQMRKGNLTSSSTRGHQSEIHCSQCLSKKTHTLTKINTTQQHARKPLSRETFLRKSNARLHIKRWSASGREYSLLHSHGIF